MTEEADFRFALEMQNKWINNYDDEDVSDNGKFKTIQDQKKPIVLKRSNPRSNFDEEFVNRTQNLVHPLWETLDPTPDVYAMFQAFDNKFFQGRLSCVTLEWSKRMYSCAGICYSKRNRFGMAITIRLSEPLLKLRPRKDLVETMLHEMIHAYCSVLGIREGNGGHGPNFKKIMTGINKVAGTNITVYHTFHEEVKVYQTHWWKCNGTCQHHSPFFGFVKRTSNRAPGPNDQWWAAHQKSCGGTFMKIKGPEPKIKSQKNNRKFSPAETDIRKFFPKNLNNTDKKGSIKISENKPTSSLEKPQPLPTQGINGNFMKSKTVLSNNMSNVVGLKDLNKISSTNVQSNTKSPLFTTTGSGNSLLTGSSSSTSKLTKADGEPVDKNLVRSVWEKRFRTKSSESCEDSKDPVYSGDNKRQKVTSGSTSAIIIVDDDKCSATSSWVTIDEDVMLQEVPNDVIDIISSDDESDKDVVDQKLSVPLSAKERQNAIIQEILDEDFGNSDVTLTNDDITIIDDEYNDDEDLANISELADTSLIDDLFDEDTLLKEFKEENDLNMYGTRSHLNDPNYDIITCPICQGKMKRNVFADHLDGCTGIVVKVELPKSIIKKLASTSKFLGPEKEGYASKKKRTKTKILQNAGYSARQIEKQLNTSNTDEDLVPNSSGQLNRRQGLLEETRFCPVCSCKINFDQINEHLDECLTK